jgi:Right handed beta helix region
MTKTAAVLLTLIALATSAQAQQRVFVSAHGLDTNPCTVTQPCRTFQHAHDTAAANGEIDVIDPAGYGPLTITKGISIQAHGFGGITQTDPNLNAITIAVTTSDPVTLNGLLIDGGGTGLAGIAITSGPSVQIINSVIRHFQFGIAEDTSISGSNLLVEDTIASDNLAAGIDINPQGGATVRATLNRITGNNNRWGVRIIFCSVTISNSVMSNNSVAGLGANTPNVAWLAKNVISGNTTGVGVGGTVFSYGDNYIRDNAFPVSGSLTPVTTQ